MASPEIDLAGWFEQTYPEYADRIQESVGRWYYLAADEFRQNTSILLPGILSRIIENARNTPDDVYINGLPLSKAEEPRRIAFADLLEHIPAEEIQVKFAKWVDPLLKSPFVPTWDFIRRAAGRHIFHHLATQEIHLIPLKDWAIVDKYLENGLPPENIQLSTIQEESQLLLDSIRHSVVELFAGICAPLDLYLPTDESALEYPPA